MIESESSTCEPAPVAQAAPVAQPAPDAQPVPDAQPAPVALQPELTATGAEYFRIWVVNLLLTIATAGLYSPWAKVRKTRYLFQNTRVGGFALDYHGKPLAILRGRVVALALLALYAFGFDFSRTVGLAAIGVLLLVGPWLFVTAQRFRFSNTSWRGVRFGFAGSVRRAYATLAPVAALWLAGQFGARISDKALVLAFVSLVCLPWMHHRLKAFQLAHVTWGDKHFSFEPALRSFYGAYLTSSLVSGAVIVPLTCAGAVVGFSKTDLGGAANTVLYAVSFALTIVATLVFWAALTARLQDVVWSRIAAPGLRTSTSLGASAFTWFVVKKALLTLATAGLYWPYAAMAVAKYRIESISITPESGSLEALASAAQTRDASATGEGALELLGMDFGL